jgi:hypothetical protein
MRSASSPQPSSAVRGFSSAASDFSSGFYGISKNSGPIAFFRSAVLAPHLQKITQAPQYSEWGLIGEMKSTSQWQNSHAMAHV